MRPAVNQRVQLYQVGADRLPPGPQSSASGAGGRRCGCTPRTPLQRGVGGCLFSWIRFGCNFDTPPSCNFDTPTHPPGS
nr:MAG TPA: hypothetical protein [Caudoviricetes sp.]